MIIKGYHKAKSSFLSIEKDLQVFIDMMLENNKLKKLLYYTTKDALSNKKPVLTDEQSVGLIYKNIKIVPKMYVDEEVLNYVVITFDNFVPNKNNPQFRDNIVSFDIICHFDQWQLEDFQLRPYRIAAELDTMFNNKHFSGIGTLQFLGANEIILNDEFGGVCLMFSAVHGEDDKVGVPNPADEQKFIEDFKEKPYRD